MPLQVRKALLDWPGSVSRSALGAKRFQGHDDHRDRRHVPAHRHDEVEELLGAEIRRKPGLVDDVIGEMQSDALCEHAARAVGNVGERPAVHDGRGPFSRLDKVRQQRVVEEHHHRADGLEVGGAHGRAFRRETHDDFTEPAPEVGAAFGQCEDRHDLGCGGDDEPGFACGTIRPSAKAGDHLPERAIVHVDGARPGDLPRVDPAVVAEMEMGIEERGQQVMGGRNGVKVAIEVQVDLVERRQRRLAAASRSTLLAKHRPERRLAERRHRLVTALDQPLSQANRGHCLALAAGRWSDRGDQDQFAATLRKAIEYTRADFRGVTTVRLEKVVRDAQLIGNVSNRTHIDARLYPRSNNRRGRLARDWKVRTAISRRRQDGRSGPTAFPTAPAGWPPATSERWRTAAPCPGQRGRSRRPGWPDRPDRGTSHLRGRW